MNVLNAFSVPTETYTRVKCRRIGIKLDWFNCVYGRTILSGRTTYVSKKNYRSNKEFDKYKNENVENKRILVVLNKSSLEKTSIDFDNNPEYFMSSMFDYEYDIIVLGFASNNFKVKKSKTFYVKAPNVLYKNDNEYLLVDNITLENACNFQD